MLTKMLMFSAFAESPSNSAPPKKKITIERLDISLNSRVLGGSLVSLVTVRSISARGLGPTLLLDGHMFVPRNIGLFQPRKRFSPPEFCHITTIAAGQTTTTTESLLLPTQDMSDCEEACSRTPLCRGFDVDTARKRCWVHGAATECGAFSRAPGFMHVSLIKCGECARAWV